MAKNKNGNKLWIAGAVLGAVAGAAYALWKTPMSGDELRGKLASGPVAQRDDVTTDKAHTPGPADKLLSKVEQTFAPIVGVELGKTANGNGVADTPAAPTTPAASAAPKTPAAPFKAAEVTEETVPEEVASTAGTTAYGTDTIRAKRFAWGSPTPEAGVQPVPVDPVAEQVVPEPAAASEPRAADPVKEPVAAGASSEYGSQSILSNRFAWGEPAPNSNGQETSTAAPQKRAEPASSSTQETRPVEAVTHAAKTPGSNLRKFPKLGGLE